MIAAHALSPPTARLLLLTSVVLACGDGAQPTLNNQHEAPDAGSPADSGPSSQGCGAEVPVDPPGSPPSVRWGSVSILSIFDQSDDAAGVPKSDVVAGASGSFYDYSGTVRTPGQEQTYGVVCTRSLVSASYEPEATELNVGTLTVEGTLEGTTSISMSSTGGYYTFRGSLLDETTTSLVVSASGSPQFEAFTVPVNDVPTRLELTAPQVGAASLGEEPFVVRWTPVGADFVVVVMVPKDRPFEQWVSCRIRDDGCFTLPEDARDHLLGTGADQFELQVSMGRKASTRTGDEQVDVRAGVSTRLTVGRAP